MARELKQWIAEPTVCAYLPDRYASLEYRLMLEVSAEELERLLAQGWRRFGPAYFRPRCSGCAECVPLRIPVDRFRPSRSQKRIRAKNADLRLRVGPPKIDAQRLQLYEKWHVSRSASRGWEHEPMDPEQYFHQFAFPHPAVREFAYYLGDDLVALAIADETPTSLSAVYTFYDPDLAHRSLGTASILFQAQVARSSSKRWLYLGYRVMGCASSAYKARFRPHELLRVWPEDGRPARWQAGPEADEL